MARPEDVVLEEVDKFMDDYIDRVFQLSQEFLVENGKIDTTNLLKSGNINRKFLEKQITYSAPYADIVEFGRNPGEMPPPQALEKWVRRKLQIVNPKEIKSVSFAIALSIKQRGITPAPYLTSSFEQANVEFKLKR